MNMRKELLEIIDSIEAFIRAQEGSGVSEYIRRGRPDGMALEALEAEVRSCTRCGLSSGRKNAVFGAGNPRAELMFIGEGPGYDEDIQGLPFVGRAGQLLTRIIEAMGLKRKDVYIANVVKCRPPSRMRREASRICSLLMRRLSRPFRIRSLLDSIPMLTE